MYRSYIEVWLPEIAIGYAMAAICFNRLDAAAGRDKKFGREYFYGQFMRFGFYGFPYDSLWSQYEEFKHVRQIKIISDEAGIL